MNSASQSLAISGQDVENSAFGKQMNSEFVRVQVVA